MNSIAANLIAQLMAALNMTSADTEPWRHDTGYPKFVNIDGATYWLKAPLNPKWRDGASSRVFGAQFVPSQPGATFLHDPSNAPDGYPCRSPGGYPLFYANPPQAMPARVSFDGQTHDDDAAVEAYITAVQNRNQALAAYHPGYSGTIPFGTLTDADWQFYMRHPEVWGQINGDAVAVANTLQDVGIRLAAAPFDEAAYHGVFRP